MFSKNLLVKIVVAVLAFGGISTMMYYKGVDPTKWFNGYPGTVNEGQVSVDPGFQLDYPDDPIVVSTGPAAPEITDQKKENECGTMIWWWDNEKYEDNVYFYRRVVGVSDFVAFKVTGQHLGGPGSFGEANLPPGTYEYKVSVVNEKGEAFSNVSQPITIDSDVCSDNSVPNKPLNPVIVSLDRFQNDTCSIRVNYEDHSLDEDGIRIYRESSANNFNTVQIAELPPSDAPTGYYDDLNLPPATYRYKVSVFNENGESSSQFSDEFVIQDEDCNVFGPPVIELPTAGPVNLPSGSANACIWTSAINVFVRKGPSSTMYPDITAVVGGTSLPVVGQSEDGQFWAVEVQPGVVGYVPKADRFGSTSGDCNPPTLQDPEAPAPAATEPPPSNTQVAACRDGIDNDGDSYIDMRDRDCANPDDISE